MKSQTVAEEYYALKFGERGGIIRDMIVFEGPDRTGHLMTIAIGKSHGNEKCVEVPAEVSCDSRAGDRGIRLNTDFKFSSDRFKIFVNHYNKRFVCAKRIDVNEGWGMNLTIQCQA